MIFMDHIVASGASQRRFQEVAGERPSALLGPIALMAHIAGVTTHLRLATAVLNNDLRHPAVLAQELATIEFLSNGRLIVGLGAGWNEDEYAAANLPFDRPGVRIDRLAEAIVVLKALLRGPAQVSGKYYQIDGFGDFPRPIQQPQPPFFVGGGGRRLLTVAARQAQIVGLSPRLGPGGGGFNSVTAAATDEKLSWIRSAAGEGFSDLEIHVLDYFGGPAISNDPRPRLREMADRVRALYGYDVDEGDLLESPHVLIGTVDQVVEKLIANREKWGINIVTAGLLEEFAPVVARLAGA